MSSSTYDIRRISMRILNARIRLNDIGWELRQAGLTAEGRSAEYHAKQLDMLFQKLQRLGDEKRDPRGKRASPQHRESHES